MGFIPSDARWYIADVVLEHRIEGDMRNVVHVNTHLIEADGPDEAYEKAMVLGRDSEHDYQNTDGCLVQVTFRGLRELNVIHEKLEDGAELMYSEHVGMPEEKLQAWNRPREKLAVFAPIGKEVELPNYMPSVFKPLLERFEQAQDEAEESPD